MFPLIAIGAALIGGAIALSSNDKTSRSRPSSSEAKADSAPLPQSYLVTPVGGAERTAQVSALEAVRNLII